MIVVVIREREIIKLKCIATRISYCCSLRVGASGEVGWFLSCCNILLWGIMNVETDITWTTIHVTLEVLLRVALHQICSNTHIMNNDHSDQTCSKVQASSCLRRSPRHLWPAPPAFIYIEFCFSSIVDFIALEAKYTQAGLLFPKAVLRVDTYVYINIWIPWQAMSVCNLDLNYLPPGVRPQRSYMLCNEMVEFDVLGNDSWCSHCHWW